MPFKFNRDLFAGSVLSFALIALTLSLASSSRFQVGSKEISTRSGSVATAQALFSSVPACPSPCQAVLDGNTYFVQTPALGLGERGAVYRLLGNESGLVVKFSRPDPESIAMLKAEAQSFQFWQDHSTANFEVSKKISTHPDGLYSIMTEVKGESLTNALFRLGLLQLDPFNPNVAVYPDLSHLSVQARQKLWSAIQDMIGVINAHPQMRTSLSPNNIYVSWKNGGTEIDRVTLIDFGVDPNSDPRYTKVGTFEDYLALSAIKIKGYLAKPSFSDPKLLEIQEQAREKHGLKDLFEAGDYRKLLEALVAKALPQRPTRGLSLSQLLALPLPDGAVPEIQAGNVTVLPPRRVGELIGTAHAIAASLSSPVQGAQVLKIGSESFRVRVPALGMGDRGVVYALEGTDEVIKVPKVNFASILTLMNESTGYEFWHKQSTQVGSAFSVPARRTLHPLGLYSIMKRDHGEPLTKAMLRMGLLTYDPVTNLAQSHPDRVRAMDAENRRKIEAALLQILSIMRSNPSMSLSISPNNLHISYADAAKTQISDVVLIDVGLSSAPSAKFDKIVDLASYVEFSRNRLEKYLKVGYADESIAALNWNKKVRSSALCGGLFARR